jgi:phosphate transport system permease protein
MILPVIISSSVEAIKSVPDTYREGSLGLGATRLRTVFRIVLPTAMPGILAGIILAIGRIVGETAALIFTSGTNVLKNPSFNLMASQRTLAIHMYMLASEGLPHSRDMAFATGSILILVVFVVNYATTKFAGRIGRSQ